MSTLDKIKKNSSVKESAVLSKSKFFTNNDMITALVAIFSVSLIGNIGGGFRLGV